MPKIENKAWRDHGPGQDGRYDLVQLLKRV